MTPLRRLCYSLRQHVGTLFTGASGPVLDLTPCESRLRREVQTLLALEMQAAIREQRPEATEQQREILRDLQRWCRQERRSLEARLTHHAL